MTTTTVGCEGNENTDSSPARIEVASVETIDEAPEGTMFRANPARTGVYDQPGPTGTQAREKWRFKMQETRLEASPAVWEGVVYLGSRNDHLYAIDAETGEEIWRSDPQGFFRSSPAVVDETVYAGSEDRHLYALNRKTGHTKWSYEAEGVVRSAPAVVGETVYVGSIDHDAYADSAFARDSIPSRSRLYALDAETGEKQWEFRTRGGVRSSPAVAHGAVYVGSWDGHLYAVDAQSGEEIWRFETGGKIYSSPAVGNGRVYFGSNDNNVYAVGVETGKEVWRFKTDAASVSEAVPRISSPALSEGTVFIGSLDGHVYALEAKSGKKRWAFEAEGRVASSPTVSEGLVYVGSEDGYVYALEAETGKKQWSFDTGKGISTSSPAIWGEAVYIGTGGTSLFAIEEGADEKAN